MGEFLHKANTDNVHSRAVIVGMVNLLNSKIYFENILGDKSVDVVYVPFFFNMGGDERFLQDYFLEWNDCIHPKHADGNYDVIPRGIVSLTSKSIDSSKLTHRFVRGNYIKEINGQIQTFSAYLNSIPITMNFDVEIEVDSNLDAFKVEQALMETFYKTQVFSVTYKGFRIPCQASFPEEYGVEKTFEFSYQADQRILVKMSIEVETYFPILDKSTERNNANRMASINIQEDWSETFTKPRFTFISPTGGEKYFSSGVLPIGWTNTGPILRVNIYYRVSGSVEWIAIVKNQENSGSFDWKLPYFNTAGKEVSYEPQLASVIGDPGRNATVRAIIDNSGSVNQIVILEKGFSHNSNSSIEVAPFPHPSTLPSGFTTPVIQAETIDGEVAGYKIIDAGSGFTPSPITAIELKIQDSNDETVFQILESQIGFAGDVNSTLSPPGNSYITNLNPTASHLLQSVPLVNQVVSGIGVPLGTEILSVDKTQNRVVINTTTNKQITNSEFTLSSYASKIYIQ